MQIYSYNIERWPLQYCTVTSSPGFQPIAEARVLCIYIILLFILYTLLLYATFEYIEHFVSHFSDTEVKLQWLH